MALPKKIKLGKLLVKQRIISREQLEDALTCQKKSGNKLGRELIGLGYLTDQQLVGFLSQQLNIEQIKLKDYRLNPAISARLPALHARRLQSLLLEDREQDILIGMTDPTDIYAYDELVRILARPIEISIISHEEFQSALNIIYRRANEMSGLVNELEQDLSQDLETTPLEDFDDGSDSPVAKFVQTMFEDALQVNASDIHIEPDENELFIRLRQDGVLHLQTKADLLLSNPLISRLKLQAGLDISEKRLPQDGRFRINVRDKRIDVRLSTIPVQNGESAVMRLLDRSKNIGDLDQTGMSGSTLKRFRKNIQSPNGMVLVTGPTGSGKSTTLYAALTELNTPEVKILTAEDPVEYSISGVNQVQINPKIDLTFANILRSFLRQDPDIILVGEIRDIETAEIALRAAMTGHLVLSTLHTNDAISSAARLIDMGAEPFLIASSLRGILAQRLVRKVCKNCRKQHKPTEQEQAFLKGMWGSAIDKYTFSRGQGCTLCNNTGYLGRLPVHEFLEMTPPVVNELKKGDISSFTDVAKQQPGFKTLATSALKLAVQGKTTIDQIMKVSFS